MMEAMTNRNHSERKRSWLARCATTPISLLLIAGAMGCAKQQKPVLYPNQTLKTYGQRAGERAIDTCMQTAAQYVDSTRNSTAAVSTASGAAVGAAAGGAYGAIWRNRGGRGAAAGAAGGAAAGLTRGVIRDLRQSGTPPPIFKRFVNHCLREQGYAPIGWQ